MKVREDKETQNHQLMRKIIEQCQYEVVEKEVYLHSSKEIVKKRNKLDLEKFKTAYMSTNVNEGIKHEIAWTRMKKEERKLKEEIEQKQVKKSTKKKNGAVGLTQEDLQELHKKKEIEEKEAKKRHLERAYAGIDRKAKQSENNLFKTITREDADKLYKL